jgi:K+ transporter
MSDHVTIVAIVALLSGVFSMIYSAILQFVMPALAVLFQCAMPPCL